MLYYRQGSIACFFLFSTISIHYGTRLVSSGNCSGGCKGSISHVFKTKLIDIIAGQDWVFTASPNSSSYIYGLSNFGYFGGILASDNRSYMVQRPVLLQHRYFIR